MYLNMQQPFLQQNSEPIMYSVYIINISYKKFINKQFYGKLKILMSMSWEIKKIVKKMVAAY